MGIYAAENVLLYVITPFCIYLMYLYYNPVMKECRFCESDGYFHTCKPNTGIHGPWCQKFNDSDVLFLSLAKRFLLLMRNMFQMAIFIPVTYAKLLPVAVELLGRILSFRPLGAIWDKIASFKIKSCAINLGVTRIDPCDSINKKLRIVSDIINDGLEKFLSTVISELLKQIVKGLKGILSVLFKGLKHLYRIVKIVFNIVIDGLNQIKNNLGNIFDIASRLPGISTFRSIFFIVIGIIAPGVIASFVAAIGVFLVIFAIPIGGFIGGTHLLTYTALALVNLVYNVFDLDVRDSKLIRFMEAII